MPKIAIQHGEYNIGIVFSGHDIKCVIVTDENCKYSRSIYAGDEDKIESMEMDIKNITGCDIKIAA